MDNNIGPDGRAPASGGGAERPAGQGWHQPAPPYQPPYQQGAYQPYPPYAQPAPAAPKKSRAWIVALVAVVLFFALMFFGMASCSRAVSSAMSMGSASAGSELDYATGDVVGVITIDGTIQYDGTTSSPEGLKEQIDLAASDSRVKAIVLRVDSGGGVATAGEEMSAYVRDCSVPVVVSSASMNASAAYEISSQADYIYTAKTTAIGAIGTAMQFTDLSGLYELLGINMENITSADSKDSSYGTRALTDEERAYYQDMVDQINETFIQAVAEGRGMTEDEVRALATGLTFTGMEAVENGLADELGTKEDAVEKAAELAGISRYSTVSLESSSNSLSGLLDLMMLDSENASVERIADALKELDGDGNVIR